MSDLISRQDAIKAIRSTVAQYVPFLNGVNETLPMECEIALRSVPSAEPKMGKWVLNGHLLECDQCGCRINRANPLSGNVWNYNFCPHCGARIEGADDDD